MKTDILQEKYNIFLKRKELLIDIDNTEEPTPSKAALQQLIAKQLNADVGHIEILDIMPKTGMPKAAARIFLWDEKRVEDLSKLKEEKK